jgi:hypothetical protein
MGAPRPIVNSLVGLAVALIVVGAVSGTIVRHVVQIAPIVLLLATFGRRPAAAAAAALPLFAFWLAIVVLIWMFMLGVSTIANGHYTPVEIAMTMVMAGCSLFGAVFSIKHSNALSLSARIGWFVLFVVLQVAAMWVSMTRAIATR